MGGPDEEGYWEDEPDDAGEQYERIVDAAVLEDKTILEVLDEVRGGRRI